jgi:hypothetical protein
MGAHPARRPIILAGLVALASVALLVGSSSASAKKRGKNVPGGIYRGTVALVGASQNSIGSTAVSLQVSHSVVSGMQVGPTPLECDRTAAITTPALSGFPAVNLKAETGFNPSDALLSVKFTQSPLNATASNPWVTNSFPNEDAGVADVGIAGTFIAGAFLGNPHGFVVDATTNAQGQLGPPGPIGTENRCSATALSFNLKRKKHHKHR